MRPSTVPVRVITAAIGLIVTPIAIGLLSSGGWGWYAASGSYGGLDISRLAGPTALQAAAIVLLVAVVLTGLWSSAGLLAAGVLSLFPIVFALFPSVVVSAYRLPVPRAWMDGISYGVPLVLLPVLGGMGLALWSARHHPRVSGALQAIGLVVAPLLLLGGGWLLSLSVARSMVALQRFQLGLAADAAAYAIGGVVLVVAGIFLTRWSPFALLLPALALLIITPLTLMRGGAFVEFLFEFGRDTVMGVTGPVSMGAGAAAALLYIAFTAVMLRARRRATAVLPHAAAPGHPTAPTYPTMYPPVYPPAP